MLSSSDNLDFARVRTDEQQTSLEEGREFRVIRKVIIPALTPLVFKFTCAVDFILFEQSIAASNGDFELYAYRDEDATESGGSFATPIPIFNKNTSSEFRLYNGARYETQTTIFTGGSITPTGEYADYDRAKVSNATAQQTSVQGGNSSKRMLSAGTYYIQLIASADAQGRFAIAWEERP